MNLLFVTWKVKNAVQVLVFIVQLVSHHRLCSKISILMRKKKFRGQYRKPSTPRRCYKRFLGWWLLFFVISINDSQFFYIMPSSTVSNVNVLKLFMNSLVLMITSLFKLISLKIINLSGSENHKVLIEMQIKQHFTVHLKIGKEHRCMVLISDYMNHDSKFVWLAQENIANFVKKQYPKVKKINYVRYVGITELEPVEYFGPAGFYRLLPVSENCAC